MPHPAHPPTAAIARGFVAGFLSTLVFHQGLLFIYHLLGAIPRVPWSMAPVPPLGLPQVISLAFWAGLWGIALALLLRPVAPSSKRWLIALGFGALAPTLVAWFVVLPLKGEPPGPNPATAWIGLTVNAIWGLGTELLLRWPRPRGQAAQPTTSMRA